jgi:hypothetical protein
VRCFVGKISRTLFLTRDSPASLLGSSVLRRQTSHLLLIRTNLGYGTVLTAACARQGCSATDYCCCCYYGSTPPLQRATHYTAVRKVCQSQVTQRRHHYYISNCKMDRTPTLKNHCNMVQQYESQLKYKWDNIRAVNYNRTLRYKVAQCLA